MPDPNIDLAREAFLLALFDKPVMYHGSYIGEKVSFAFRTSEPWQLRQMLDMGNQQTFDRVVADA